MSSEPTGPRPGAVALAGLALLLALGALALLAGGPDDAGGRAAVVTSGSGGPAPEGVTPAKIDPHGAAAPGRALDDALAELGARAPGEGPAGAATTVGPGEVVDGRQAAPASGDPAVQATGVAGRVVTKAGAPVAGATVTARGARPDAGGVTVMTMTRGPDGEVELSSPGEVRRSATTDAEGRFQVMGLDAAFRFTPQVRPPAPSPGGAEDLLGADPPGPSLKPGQVVDAGDLVLPRAARLSGVVRDPAGRPLGVTVTATSGAKASFRVEVTGPGSVRRDLRLPAEAAGAPVTVRVLGLAQGGPLAGAHVTLEREDDGPVARFELTTGPDGAARFEGVPSGRFVASAIAPGCARARASFDVTSGGGDGPTLSLSAGGALLVEVLGAGQGEARLVLRRGGGRGPSDVWFTSATLGARARFDGLEVGARYEVRASAGGHEDAQLTLTCEGVDPQAPATLRLRPLP